MASIFTNSLTGSDIFVADNGDETLDGGAGVDQVVYAGIRSNYTLLKVLDGYTIKDNVGIGGLDTLFKIEQLAFSDAILSLGEGSTVGWSPPTIDLGTLSGLRLNLIAPWTDSDGSVYYFVDTSGDGKAWDFGGAAEDVVTHDQLDALFNGAVDTTDVSATRNLTVGTYRLTLPSATEWTGIYSDKNFQYPPVDWQTHHYWTSTISGGGSHIAYTADDVAGVDLEGNLSRAFSDTSTNFTVLRVEPLIFASNTAPIIAVGQRLTLLTEPSVTGTVPGETQLASLSSQYLVETWIDPQGGSRVGIYDLFSQTWSDSTYLGSGSYFANLLVINSHQFAVLSQQSPSTAIPGDYDPQGIVLRTFDFQPSSGKLSILDSEIVTASGRLPSISLVDSDRVDATYSTRNGVYTKSYFVDTAGQLSTDGSIQSASTTATDGGTEWFTRSDVTPNGTKLVAWSHFSQNQFIDLSVTSASGVSATFKLIPEQGAGSLEVFGVTALSDQNLLLTFADNSTQVKGVIYSIDGQKISPSVVLSESNISTSRNNIVFDSELGQIVSLSSQKNGSIFEFVLQKYSSIDLSLLSNETLSYNGTLGIGGLSLVKTQDDVYAILTSGIDNTLLIGTLTNDLLVSHLAEHLPSSTVALDVDATDSEKSTLIYAISGQDSDMLQMDPSSGEVRLLAPADFATKQSYKFNVIASDGVLSSVVSARIDITESIDTAPFVIAFGPSDEAMAVAIGANVVVTFNEAVQRGTGNIVLKSTDGVVVATYDAATSANLSISGSTLTINPTADLGYSTGYKVEFAAGSIKDIAGNSYAGVSAYNFTTGAAPETADTSSPTVSSLEITSATGASNSTLNAGDVVTVTVTMSEATTVTGTPQLALNIGGTSVNASYASGSGTTALLFKYTVLANQTDANGISINADTLALNSGTLKDAAGNRATLTYTALTDNASYMVDTTAPTITLLAASASAGTVTLTYSSPLDASNAPTAASFTVTTGGAVNAVTAVSIVGAVVTLTVTPFAAGSITVAYADPTSGDDAKAIQDLAGNDAAGFASGVVADGDERDTTAPALVSSSPADDATAVSVSANLVLTFSEPIEIGTGNIVLTNTTNAADTRTISVSDSNQVNIAGSQLTINPSADLLGSGHYAVTLGSGALQDLTGNTFTGISLPTTLDFTVASASTKPTLSGIAYDWKNHMLLQDVAVAVKGGGTPAEGVNAPIQFKGLAWDATGHASVEVWAHADAAVENMGFDLEITNASSITFTAGTLPKTSTGGTGWTLITNASGTNLTVGGFANDTSAAVAAGDLKIGTITFETATLQRADLHLVGGDVGNTSATAYGLSMARASSNASGAFSISTLEPGSYGLSASRPVTDIGNAISSADALATLKIAVGLNPNLDPDGTGPLSALALSPYQFMAADVVGTDGRITSADALAILKMAVKMPTAPAKEWMFVEESRDFWNEATGQFTVDRTHASWDHSISTTLQSEATVNLVGVLKGDVNGSWVAPVGSTDLDAIDPTYFSTLSSIFGMPLTQFAIG